MSSSNVSSRLHDSPRQQADEVPLVEVQPDTPVGRQTQGMSVFFLSLELAVLTGHLSLCHPSLGESASSLLTHSDKLTDLPSSPASGAAARGRVGTFGRGRRSEPSLVRETTASISAPALQQARTSESDGGEGKETPKQRVSFDSVLERASLPSFQNVRQGALSVSC